MLLATFLESLLRYIPARIKFRGHEFRYDKGEEDYVSVEKNLDGENVCLLDLVADSIYVLQEEVEILDDPEEQPLYKLWKEWSDIKGDYEYVLYQREIDGEALIRAWNMGWHPTVGPFRYKRIAAGDRDWAVRVTKHHGYAISSVITGDEKIKAWKANRD